MAFGHDEERVRAERARAIGLFRYSLIREAADGRLSTKQRGRLVRALAEREHAGPVRAAGAGLAGHDRPVDPGLAPRRVRRPGPDPAQGVPRTPADVLELAVALKKEVPERTAVQIAAILRAHSGWSPDERTLQRHFVRLELNTRPDGQPPQAFGRFEADAPNERWTGDALHGPTVNGRKAILFAFVDDHSRLFAGYRWARREDTVRLEAALRTGVAGPRHPGLDLRRQRLGDGRQATAARVRVAGHPARPLHARSARRQRQDREVVPHRAGSVPRRDRLRPRTRRPGAVEHAVHRVGRDGLPPAGAFRDRADPARALVGASRRRCPRPAQLREAFLWSEWRTVTKTAHRRAARQQLRSRRRAGRPQGRAGLRPVRPHPHRGPLARPVDGQRGAAPDRPARARQGPPRRHDATGSRHRPGSTTCAWSSSSTPPNWPSGCSTPPDTCPTEPVPDGHVRVPAPAARHRRRRHRHGDSTGGDRTRCRRDREAEVALRVHQDPVRPLAGAADAAPARRPRRSRRPHRLVHQRTRPRRGHRRSRRRQDRRRPRRPRRRWTPAGTR